MSIQVRAGDKIPLNVVLDDGATDKFVRAFLFDDANNPVGSPVPLTHIGEGLYRDASVVATVPLKRVFAVYEVFDDAGFIWPAYEYDLRTEDVFDISAEGARSSYQICVPPKLELPLSGTKTYRFVLYVFDDAGLPVDPDSSQAFVHIEDIDNNVIVPNTAMTREQVGVYLYRYTIASTDPERPLWIEFLFERGGVSLLTGQVTETIATDAHTQSLDLVKLTAQRALNLDNLDVAVSSRQSASAAISQSNTIRNDISNVDSHLDALDTALAAIHSETARIGVPTNGTLAADNAVSFANDLSILNLLSRLGIPSTGTLAGDIAALNAHLSAQDAALASIKSDTDLIGTPPFGSLAMDDQAILDAIQANDANETVTQGQITALDAKVGTPANGTVSADIAAVQGNTSTLVTRLTAQRASNLDNLDVAVSSRESEADASNRYTALFQGIQAVLAGIGAIPNNTSFVGIVPPTLVLPPQPVSKTYKFFVNLFDAQGLPEDPDAGVTFRIEDVTGAVIVAATAMVRTSAGSFYCQYPVEWDDAERTLFVIFSYAKNTVPFQQTRITEVQEYESKLDLLLQRLTQTRAANLDRIDATTSSRASALDLTTYYADLAARSQAILDEANFIQLLLGTPVVTLAADIAGIQSWVQKIGNPTTGTLAGDLGLVRTDTQRIGIPTSGTLVGDIAALIARIQNLDADVAAVYSDTQRIGTPAGGTVAQALADIRAKLGPAALPTLEDMINSINVQQVMTLLGIPAHGTVSLDIAALSTVAGLTQASVTTIQSQTAQIPAMASTVSTIETQVAPLGAKIDAANIKLDSLMGIEPKVDEANDKLDALEASCQTVDNHIQAIPLNPLRDNDPRLTFIDAPISSRATPADVGGGGSSLGVFMGDIVGTIDSNQDEIFGLLEEEPAGELQGILDGNEDAIGVMEDEE